MKGIDFKNLIEFVFCPFLAKLGFELEPVHLSGRYYRASFVSKDHTLVIAFEPGDNHVTVMLLINGDDDLNAIDDPTRSPRLSHLNARYMAAVTPAARTENERYFSQFRSQEGVEQILLKCAKELRLVLPLHLSMQGFPTPDSERGTQRTV